LSLICKDGHKNIAWFLVLIPFILFFLLLGVLLTLDDGREGLETMKKKDEKKADEDHKKASVAHKLKEQLDQTKKMLEECRKDKKDDKK
jgi:flagellar biosynthesis/type III secretory pathway M-ring protein FliF/YscJ